MRHHTSRAFLLITALGLAIPLLAEASWLTRVKDFFRIHEPAEDATLAASTPAPVAGTESAAEYRLPPARQSGNHADFVLSGSWGLTKEHSREKIGSLRADGAFFTLSLQEPRIDLRTAYKQGADGGFRCTVLDKNVITMEGRFDHKDSVSLRVDVKDIGRPAVKTYQVVATRER